MIHHFSSSRSNHSKDRPRFNTAIGRDPLPASPLGKNVEHFPRQPKNRPRWCAILFCQKDLEQAKLLLDWMRDLGGEPDYPVLLLGETGLPKKEIRTMIRKARKVFLDVRFRQPAFRLPDEGWPRGSNWLFLHAAYYFYYEIQSDFWLNEPDCIPLKSGWLERLEEEYERGGKPFMGHVVEDPNIERHLTGNAFYHRHLFEAAPELGACGNMAFDMVISRSILPRARHTDLFQHHWVESGSDSWNYFHELGKIRNNAVVFHRNKDGSLIRLLRNYRSIKV